MITTNSELLDAIMRSPEQATTLVKCAIVGFNPSYEFDRIRDVTAETLIKHSEMFDKMVVLKENWNAVEWCEFLTELNFNYNNYANRQFLYGFVWFKDGSWLERYFGGSFEHWVHKRTPDIPIELGG